MKRIVIALVMGLSAGLAAGVLSANEKRNVEEAVIPTWAEYEMMFLGKEEVPTMEGYNSFVKECISGDYSGRCLPNADPDGKEIERLIKAAH